ncbi:hypothetical protein MKEN_00473200 [Mycena kentingensis (nom. inval.)]|nr:hypothetical protein MKEN_00473200 [Mycena kentingensis (nom. inval.)]
MCTIVPVMQPCAVCGRARQRGLKKTIDCRSRKCPHSLVHPTSLQRNGCALYLTGPRSAVFVRVIAARVHRTCDAEADAKAGTSGGRVKVMLRFRVQELRLVDRETAAQAAPTRSECDDSTTEVAVDADAD